MRPEKDSFDDLIKRKLQEEEEPVSGTLWENIANELPKTSTKKRFVYYSIAVLLLLSSAGIYYSANDGFFTQTLVGNNIETSNAEDKSNLPIEPDKKSFDAILNNNNTDEMAGEIKKSVATLSGNETFAKPKARIKKSNKKNNFVFADAEIVNPSTDLPIAEAAVEQPDVTDSGNSTNQSDNIRQEEVDNAIGKTEEAKEEIKATEPEKAIAKDSTVLAGDAANSMGIEISFSPDVIFKTWSLNNSTQDYLDTRKETERFVFAHTYGAKVFYKVGKHVEVKTGIYLSEVTELLHYSYISLEPNDLFTKLDPLTGSWVNPATQQTVNDTTITNFIYPDDVVSSNQYKFYNLPLQVSLYNQHHKIKYGITTGVMMNFSFLQKGSIMAAEKYSKVLFSNKNLNPYKQSIGLGLTASTFVSYSIRKNVRFFMEPEYRMYLNRISKKEAPLNERISSLSFMTGLQLDF